jgi:hypothetical protein
LTGGVHFETQNLKCCVSEQGAEENFGPKERERESRKRDGRIT